jgi:extracellular matrix protein 14
MQSEAEAAALAEAVTVLMLDVWEFTAEWVDVRLSKDVVRLPSGIHVG